MVYDPFACGDMLSFSIGCLRTRLGEMLPRAGAVDLATKIDGSLVNRVVDEVAAVAAHALANVRRLRTATAS